MTSPFIQQIADNRVCQVLTCLPEKFVVDFANGIDVAQEHIRTAGERTFFRRLKEGLTGEGVHGRMPSMRRLHRALRRPCAG